MREFSANPDDDFMSSDQREILRLRSLSQNNAHSWDALVRERDALRATLLKAYQFISPLSDPLPITAGEMAREIMSALSSGERTES